MQQKKSVFYIELIYDLIFIYIVGRNNALLHHIENGFVTWQSFSTYLLCTLAVIQIWNFSTYYMNLFWKKSVRNYVFLFLNMFLLYFMAAGTHEGFSEYQTQYVIAWGVILLNHAAQYVFEYADKKNEALKPMIRSSFLILLIQAAMVLISLLFSGVVSIILTVGAVAFGIVAPLIRGSGSSIPVDFHHLSERAMLYVVFTFGEMIIAIASYFQEGLSLNNIYFALMAFLIVVGLFLGYGVLYDRIIDREGSSNGLVYLFFHVFIIFSLNNISCGLEFMHEEEVALMPKMLFLLASFVIYYVFLMLTGIFKREACRHFKRMLLTTLVSSLVFIALMLIFRENMKVNIAVTVVYVFSVFVLLYRYAKNTRAERFDEDVLD